MKPMTTSRSTRADTGSRAGILARRLGVVALAGFTTLGLTACGADAEPEVVDGPIILKSSRAPGSPAATPTPSTPSGTASGTASGTPSGSSSATPRPAPVVATVRDPLANLDVDDQRGDGDSVRVAEVRLTAGTGHVVVIAPRTREVLGSLPVSAGTARAVAMPLTVRVARSSELVALLYADNGDGIFDPVTDGPVVDDDDDDGLETVDDDFDYTLR